MSMNRKTSFSVMSVLLSWSLAASVAFCPVAGAQSTAVTAAATKTPMAEMSAQQFADWGEEALAMIRKDLWMPERSLYADKVKLGEKPRDPAFMWGGRVQLTALSTAAQVEPQKYTAPARDYYEITGQQRHLDEARRIAQAAKARWIKDDGSMDATGRFAHLLLGSMLELGRVDNDPQWMETTAKVLTYLHEEVRDPNGHYPENWRALQETALQEFGLIDQASAARAYWELALEMRAFDSKERKFALNY